MYLSGATRAILAPAGKFINKNAVAGHTIENQLASWLVNPQRKDARIKWIFVQCGINNVLNGAQTAAQIDSAMGTLLAQLASDCPLATILPYTMDPAKAKLDTTTLSGGPDRYALWQAVQALYVGRGFNQAITSSALNDGADNLAAAYDSGDGLHPNEAGNQLADNTLLPVLQALPGGW